MKEGSSPVVKKTYIETDGFFKPLWFFLGILVGLLIHLHVEINPTYTTKTAEPLPWPGEKEVKIGWKKAEINQEITFPMSWTYYGTSGEWWKQYSEESGK